MQVNQFHLPVSVGFLEDLLQMAARGIFRDMQQLRGAGQGVAGEYQRAHPSLCRTQFELPGEGANMRVMRRMGIPGGKDHHVNGIAFLRQKNPACAEIASNGLCPGCGGCCVR